MKLTPQQIQFIDNFLEHAGVHYIDVRIEMTDHIATALEKTNGDFVQQFKAYIAENKKSLLEQNTDFRKLAKSKAFKLIGLKLIQPVVLIGLIVLLTGVVVLPQYIVYSKITDIYFTAYSISVMLLFVLVIYLRIFTKNTYSVLDQLTWICVLLGCLINAWRFISNEYILLVYYTLAMYFMLAVLLSFYSMHKIYRSKYRFALHEKTN